MDFRFLNESKIETMILSFSKEIFKTLIQSGVKILTIREDKGARWEEGKTIHFWHLNPRNKSDKCNPHQFGEMTCTGTEQITIRSTGEHSHNLSVSVNGHELTLREIYKLAEDDGQSLEEFKDWFVGKDKPDVFEGKIVHWTDNRFGPIINPKFIPNENI